VALLVTTSTFTADARETVGHLTKRIVLIDGDDLARLMIRYNVGCRIEETLHLKKVDEDFWHGQSLLLEEPRDRLMPQVVEPQVHASCSPRVSHGDGVADATRLAGSAFQFQGSKSSTRLAR
jgi:hypothetical protein